MKCLVCGAEVAEGALFCTTCGASMTPAPEPEQTVTNEAPAPAPAPAFTPEAYYDVTDHTAEYDEKDISDNKVFAILPYLFSVIGVIIALLGAKDSPFTMFHVRQALKIHVTVTLLGIVMALLCWTIIVPIIGAICLLLILIICIICFFRACAGQAKEVPIISNFGFLK